MRRFLFVYLGFILFVMINAPVVHAGSMTLTTYYPAPFGSYAKMRLVPQAAESGSCDPGSVYVNTDSGDIVEYCHSSGAWGYLPGVWTQNPGTDQVFLSDLSNNPGIMVGVGTDNPTNQLQVTADGADATMMVERVGGGNLLLTASQSTAQIGSTGTTNVEMITDNTTRIFISGQGRVGVNTTNPDDHDLELNGQMEISVVAGTDSKIKMVSGATSYAMGIDATDGNFTISRGDDISTSGVYVKLTPTGLIVNGPVQVKVGSDPLGEIKLKYISAGAQSGYYALYAP